MPSMPRISCHASALSMTKFDSGDRRFTALNRNLDGFTQNLSYFPRDHSKSVHMHLIYSASHCNSPYMCHRRMAKGCSVAWSVRSTRSQMWLSNLACISINPELVTSISIRELQQPFLNAKTRRIFEWQQMDKRKIVSLYNSYVYINLSQICKSIPNKQIIWKYFLVIE